MDCSSDFHFTVFMIYVFSLSEHNCNKKVFTSECAIPIALEEIFGWRVHADSLFTSSTLSGISCVKTVFDNCFSVTSLIQVTVTRLLSKVFLSSKGWNFFPTAA